MTRLVMGGTFDPVHEGHLASALAVSKLLGDARVMMIPSQLPPHRQAPHASAAHRWAMLELATANCNRLMLDARELHRQGVSYTWDTLASIREEIGAVAPLVFVLGSDAYNALDQWRSWRQLTDIAHLLILARPGHGLSPAEEVTHWACGKLTALADDLLRRPAGCIHQAELAQVEISATAVRQAVAEGKPLKGMVPDAVADYIHSHSLYKISNID